LTLRAGAFGALLLVALIMAAGAAAATAMSLEPLGPPKLAAVRPVVPRPVVLRTFLDRGGTTVREGVLSATPELRPTAPAATPQEPSIPTAAPAPLRTVTGIASTYPATAGWDGQATVALPGALGGAYTGAVNGHVTVCADRCARLPVVDWCDCYWGTEDQRVVDLSHAAWPLVSDQPLERGLIEVRLLFDP
jgi:hypothetical protein